MKKINFPTISSYLNKQLKMDAKAFSVYVDKHSNQIESVEFIPPVLGKDNDFGHFVVTEKPRKTIRRPDEYKKSMSWR